MTLEHKLNNEKNISCLEAKELLSSKKYMVCTEDVANEYLISTGILTKTCQYQIRYGERIYCNGMVKK